MEEETAKSPNEAELALRLEEIERRERELAIKEKVAEIKSFRHNIYERVNVSLATMDRIIFACGVVIVALVVAGVTLGNN